MPAQRIYFFSPFCILRNSTNRIFDMRMCDAMAGQGVPVTLVFPYVYQKENLELSQLFAAYNTRNKFGLRMLRTPLSLRTNSRLRNSILLLAFFFATLRIIFSNLGRLRSVVIVSRDAVPLVPILVLRDIFGSLIPVKTVIQMHELKKKRLHTWVYKQCSGVMPNVPIAKKRLIEEWKIEPEKIMVMNAPMIDFSSIDISKEEARKKIGYTGSDPLVVYTGKVGRDVAEVNYILQTAAILRDVRFILTGGRQPAVEHFKRICSESKLDNVTFTGFLPELQTVRYYQLAADVLVSYYNTHDHLVDYNYPQKVQEYISTRNPVVTPDFAATREVINNSNAFLVEPESPRSFADGIREAITNKQLAKEKAEAAYAVSRTLTFDARIKEFIRFFSSLQ